VDALNAGGIYDSSVLVSWFFHRFRERLEGLVEGVPFEVLDQNRDSVRIDPCFATVVAGSQSVGVVSLIDKGAVGFNEFFDSRPETAGKGGEDGFVDDPFLARVIGIVVDCERKTCLYPFQRATDNPALVPNLPGR
jgi:hypothetical protein